MSNNLKIAIAVLATAAVTVPAGGYAASRFVVSTTAQVKDQAITSADLKDGTVLLRDLAPAVRKLVQATPAARAKSATLRVGVDVAPGTYRNAAPGPDCYWARLSGFSGELKHLIANDNVAGPTVVTIEATDKGFTYSRCAGSWTRVG